MCGKEFLELLMENPVVAAVKNDDGLDQCLCSECRVVFVLYGTVLTIGEIVNRLKEAGKTGLVHVDLIDGLAIRDAAVDFIARTTRTDGVLSTKASLIRHAKLLGLLTVQRFFLLDSIALYNIEKQMPLEDADAMEILPGVMPKIIRKLTLATNKPIISGGLISDKEDIINALEAGALAISSTRKDIWFM